MENDDEIREDGLVEETVVDLADEVFDSVEDEEQELEEESEEDETDWKAEALKYKAIALRNKKKSTKQINNKLTDKAQTLDGEVGGRIANLEMAERKRQFQYDYGLSPKEVDRVFKVDPNPTAETLKDPFIKAGLQAIRSQERVDNNTPSSSAKSPVLNRQKFNKLSDEQKQAEYHRFLKSKGIEI
jgi:hypothetical protein